MLTAGFLYSKHIDLETLRSIWGSAELIFLFSGYGVAAIVLAVRVCRWRSILNAFSIAMGGTTLFLMYLVDIFFSNFISGLSMAVRGLYIDKKTTSTALITRLLLLDKLFDWIIPVSLGLISFLFVLMQWPPARLWKAWGVCAILLPYAVWNLFAWLQRLTVFRKQPDRRNKVHAKLVAFISFDLKQYHFSLFLRVFVFSLLGFLTYYLVLLLLAKCFTLPIGLTGLIMADTMATISVVIPLNFAGIGTRDVALVALLTYYQCPHESIVLFIASLVLLRLSMSLMGWGSMYILKKRGHSIAIKL